VKILRARHSAALSSFEALKERVQKGGGISSSGSIRGVTIASSVVHSLMAAPSPQVKSGTSPEPKRVTARASLRLIAREPIAQFVVLGLLIWGSAEYRSTQQDRYIIHIGSAQRQRIAVTYLQQFGQFPTPRQLQGLIDRYIREEIYLREGLALQLDKDDEIVRRRIVQKYEFLQSDLAVPDSPGSGVLERWFEQNQLRYLTPERVAFSQVYFSADKEGEEAGRVRALKVLKDLRGMHTSRAPGLGDAFPGPSDVGALAPEEAARLFGKSEFAEQLFKLPVGQWAGPYRSGYGWHLVYVTGHLPPVLPPLTQIREQVLADYLEEQRRILNGRAFEKLRAQYTIRDDGERR
jgi:peptidyl-prolyl cis-trans isomerase C